MSSNNSRLRLWTQFTLITTLYMTGFPVNALECNNEIPNCVNCTSSSKCTGCARFTGLKVYAPQVVLCQVCSTNAYCTECTYITLCTRCNSTSYGPDFNGNGTCSPCIANCNSCPTSGGGKCDACMAGLYLLTSPSYSCIKCYDNCTSCTATGPGYCTGCKYGFALNSQTKTCSPCSDNCTSCTALGQGSCTSCKSGFALNSQTSTCAACGGNCLNCNQSGATNCDSCMSGFILYRKKCVVGCTPASTSCTTCNSDNVNCNVCPVGYTKTTSASSVTICTAPTQTIPDVNCSLPFTYSKQLYYTCILSTPGLYVCLGPNRVWMFCRPTGANGAVYVAQNTTKSLTFTGYSSPTNVTCVNDWIVMQQRISASVSFHQSWAVYRDGFGLYNGNFWLGNNKIFQLTGSGGWELRIEMLLSVDNGWYSAEYSSFSVGSEATNFTLAVDGFSGDTGNGMISDVNDFNQTGQQFSTFDRPNDKRIYTTIPISNAVKYQGGFWYKYDCDACLNSAYNDKILWYDPPPDVSCSTCPLVTVRMMIKKRPS